MKLTTDTRSHTLTTFSQKLIKKCLFWPHIHMRPIYEKLTPILLMLDVRVLSFATPTHWSAFSKEERRKLCLHKVLYFLTLVFASFTKQTPQKMMEILLLVKIKSPIFIFDNHETIHMLPRLILANLVKILKTCKNYFTNSIWKRLFRGVRKK